MRLELLRELAAVERLAFGSGDFLEHVCMVGKPETLARLGRATVRQEVIGEAGLGLQLRNLFLPLPGDGRRDQEAIAAVADRALEQLLERQLAPALVHLHPRRNAAGHGDAVPAAHRHGLLAGEEFWRPGRGRAAGGVQAVQLAAVPEDGVGVRADAVRHRLDQREGDRGGEDRVDGAAAIGEHLQARLRGEWLRSRDHVLRKQRLARPRVRVGPRKAGHRFPKM